MGKTSSPRRLAPGHVVGVVARAPGVVENERGRAGHVVGHVVGAQVVVGAVSCVPVGPIAAALTEVALSAPWMTSTRLCSTVPYRLLRDK